MTDLLTIVTVLLAASLIVTLVLQRIGRPRSSDTYWLGS